MNMKKYQYIFAVLLAIAACQKNEVAPETIDEEPVWGYITAEVSTPAVKGVLVDGEDANTLDFKWEVGDKIRMAVNKGTLETPNYAYRNGYIYSVNDGEHTVTIKYDKGTGENIANYIVGAWYPWLDKENSEPKAIRTTQDYSIGKVSIPLHATNVSTENPIDVGTSAGADVELSQKLVFGPYNPGGTAFSVLGFRLKKGGADRTIKSIKVNKGSQDYTLTNINTALTDDVQYFYIVLPASDTPLSNFKATITANDGVNDLEYTRTKSSYTPTAGKVTRFPIISDMDETGKYRWKLGTSGSFYPADVVAKSIFRTNPFTIIDKANTSREEGNTTIKSNYITLQTGNATSTYRGDFALMSLTSSHLYYGKMEGSNSILYRTASDAERLTVHAGNYPIVAVKMTNLRKKFSGDGNYSLKLNVKQYEGGNYVLEANNYSWHNLRVIGTQTEDIKEFSDGDDALVYWFDLTSKNFKSKINNVTETGLSYPTTQTKDICDLGFVLADIKNQATAPTVDINWIGTFSNTSELMDFVSKN